MIAREGAGWQMVIADLSLILFMVAASALERRDGAPPPLPDDPAIGEALAVYRPEGPETLDAWLAAQAPDARQQLTILVRHPPGGAEAALEQALALMREAPAASPRLIVQPSESASLVAFLAYDHSPEEMARPLLEPLDRRAPAARGDTP